MYTLKTLPGSIGEVDHVDVIQKQYTCTLVRISRIDHYQHDQGVRPPPVVSQDKYRTKLQLFLLEQGDITPT